MRKRLFKSGWWILPGVALGAAFWAVAGYVLARRTGCL